jgi:hypothetical protein
VSGDVDEEFDGEIGGELGETAPPSATDIKMIIAALYDQERSHVLGDMIEGMGGERPPDDAFHPRKNPIRDPAWRAARKRLKKQKSRERERVRRSPEAKAAELKRLTDWKEQNPDKVAAADARRQEAIKQERGKRPFVAVDLEGFDTTTRTTGAISRARCTRVLHAATEHLRKPARPSNICTCPRTKNMIPPSPAGRPTITSGT